MNLRSIGNKILIDYFRITATVVAVAILGLGYLTFIQSRVDELRTSGFLERARVTADIQASEAHLQQVQASVAKFKQALPEDKRKTVDTFLPTGTDFPGLVLTIEDIAKAANLDLTTVAVSLVSTGAAPIVGTSAAAAPGVNLLSQDVSISVDHGQSYETFKQFVSLLESSQRLFDVMSVAFDHPANESGGIADSTYSVTVRTYYLPAKP